MVKWIKEAIHPGSKIFKVSKQNLQIINCGNITFFWEPNSIKIILRDVTIILENRNGGKKRSAEDFEIFVAALAPAIPDIVNGVAGIAAEVIKAAVQGGWNIFLEWWIHPCWYHKISLNTSKMCQHT